MSAGTARVPFLSTFKQQTMQGKVLNVETGSNEHGEYKKAKVQIETGTKTCYISPKARGIYPNIKAGQTVTLKAKDNGSGFLIAAIGAAAPATVAKSWDNLSGAEFAEKAEKAIKVYAYLLRKAKEHGFEGQDAVDAANAVLNLLK